MYRCQFTSWFDWTTQSADEKKYAKMILITCNRQKRRSKVQWRWWSKSSRTWRKSLSRQELWDRNMPSSIATSRLMPASSARCTPWLSQTCWRYSQAEQTRWEPGTECRPKDLERRHQQTWTSSSGNMLLALSDVSRTCGRKRVNDNKTSRLYENAIMATGRKQWLAVTLFLSLLIVWQSYGQPC